MLLRAGSGWHATPLPAEYGEESPPCQRIVGWHDGHDSSARHAADGQGQAASRQPTEAMCNDTPRLALHARSAFFSYGDGVPVGVAVAVMAGPLIALGRAALLGRAQAASPLEA